MLQWNFGHGTCWQASFRPVKHIRRADEYGMADPWNTVALSLEVFDAVRDAWATGEANLRCLS